MNYEKNVPGWDEMSEEERLEFMETERDFLEKRIEEQKRTVFISKNYKTVREMTNEEQDEIAPVD